MAESQHEYTEVLTGDDELINAVREGDTGAYATLYERHCDAARGLARQLVRGDAEVDDVVAETFTRVLSVVQRGGGPEHGFRPYLLTSLRHVVYDRHRGEKRQVPTDDMESFDRGEPFVDPALEGLERTLIARAYLSLPERWQAVLWHTEIEGGRPAAVAPLLGMSANSVAALAYRAREGLRQSYLQMHLAGGAAAESCRPALEQLGAYIRGGLAARERARVDGHLDGCADCRAVYAELADVNSGLRGIILPIVVGPAAAGYLAALPAGLFSAGWWGSMPKGQQQATAAGVAATAVVAAAALAMVGNEQPIRPEPEQPAAAAPPGAPAPPGAQPPAPRPPGAPQPPAAPPMPPPPAGPVALPMPPPPGSPPDGPGAAPADPDDPERPTPIGVPAFAAQIDPVGSLVPGRQGIVVMNVRNTGERTAKDVVAAIELPEGVTLAAAPGAGNAAPTAPADSGGWSCTPTAAGAECVLMGMDAGQDSSEYLDVDVAIGARAGDPPSIAVSAGTQEAAAEGTRGVDPEGISARYAEAGRVRVETAGNALLTCVEKNKKKPGHRWPWWHGPPDSPGHGKGKGPSPGPGRPGADERPAPAPPKPAGTGADAADEQRAPAGRGVLDPPGGPGAVEPSGGPLLPDAPLSSPGTPDPTRGPDAPGPPDGPGAATPSTPAPDPSAPEPSPSPSPAPSERDGPCAQAQKRKGDQVDNDLWNMRPMDLDSDDGTDASSSARWTLPEGGQVRWAGLYFSGVGSRSGASAKLRGPGADAYTEVAASEVETAELPGYTAYQAFADVTEQVRKGGGGEWWLADAPTRTGMSAYAGWSLVVVVEDPAESFNQAMVLDGTGSVFQDEEGIGFPFAGLLPASVPATVDVVAWEGDAGLDGDRVLLNGSPLSPKGTRRSPDNAFASAARGAVGPPLTFGTDVARFSAPLPTDPKLSLVSTGDAYLAGVIAVTSPMRT